MGLQKLGKYELLETLGAGAMSTVYRAKDLDSDETVAIKLLHPHLCHGENLARFEREARVLSTLRHRNIVRFHTFEDGERGHYFIVLEWLEGDRLLEFLEKERQIHPDLSAMMILDLARGMSDAHSKGIIHRDLKPENILISKNGILKITDFGLAHLWEGGGLTAPGARVGSPAYMSPEQIRGEAPSSRMDVFSLGIIFYLLLTSELPFKGKNRRDTFNQILGKPPKEPRNRNPVVPSQLSEICFRMVSKDHSRRLVSMDDVVRELEDYLALLRLFEYENKLARYLADPKDSRNEIRKWLLDAYLLYGKNAVERQDRQRAFETFQTVLELSGVNLMELKSPSEALKTKKIQLTKKLHPGFWIILFLVFAMALLALGRQFL